MGDGTELTLAGRPFTATPTGLQLPASKPPIEQWLAYGEQLRSVQGALRWVIGDWLNYGEEKYGEMYSQAYTLLPEYHESSVRHMRRVASAFPLVRRRTGVSWSIHAELASAPPAWQDELLDLIEAHDMGREELRAYLKDEEPDLSERHECPLCGAVHVVIEERAR